MNCQTSETSITIEVRDPDSGGVDNYVASCSGCNNSQTEEKPAGGVVKFFYGQLQTAVEYRIEVHSVFGTKTSEIKEVYCTTGERGKLSSKIMLFGIHYIADADSFLFCFFQRYIFITLQPQDPLSRLVLQMLELRVLPFYGNSLKKRMAGYKSTSSLIREEKGYILWEH